VEFHQLEYALAVADVGTFRGAAERCHVSQPSLSVQVGKLERELGGRLFERLQRGVAVTPLGERFLPQARAILQRAEAARAEAREEGGMVRLGVIPTVAPFWLPRVLPVLREALPRIDYRVREEPTEQLFARLGRAELDFVVASPPFADSRLRTTPLLREELLLAVPSGHPLSHRRSPRLDEVVACPWILLMEMHCLRDQIVSFCGTHGRRLDTVLETSQLASLTGLVAAGLGVSLVPEMAAGETAGVVYRRLAPPRPMRELALVAHEEHHQTVAARRFAEECVRLCGAARGPRRPPTP
jgi:LysR family hydrogen peroxide-inducible transcriptional activator